MSKYRTYLVEYPLHGGHYIIEIKARDDYDATLHVEALKAAQLLGQLELKIPVPTLIGRFIIWLKGGEA